MLEQSVQHLKTCCEQQARRIQDDDDRRNAYAFIARPVTVEQPRPGEFHAHLTVWIVDCRVRAQEIRTTDRGQQRTSPDHRTVPT